MVREWYVYLPAYSLVLSGYATETEAKQEAERVREHIPETNHERIEVLHRSHEHILEYARTHPAWAKREGFEFVQAQTAPPHACPLCPETVAGGPDEYLGHIRTEHPEEWRRLKTDPGYALRPQRVVVPLPEEERVREVAVWTLDLLREKGPMTDREISDQLDVPIERVSKATDKLMSEGKLEWEALTGKYRTTEFKIGVPRAEAGIMRCRYCGAPYAYHENLEIHERGCPRRAG